MTQKSDQVTLQTLAGLLARTSPRIYTIKSASPALTNRSVDDDTTVFWLADLQAEPWSLQFSFKYLHDLPGLLGHFRKDIAGYVKYDTTTKSTNAALIRCAASDGLIAAGNAGMFETLKSTDIPQVGMGGRYCHFAGPPSPFQLNAAA
eukprot:SAG22_NODE_1243_length_5022_cov_3.983953_4_plen_148_part_00